MEIGALRNRLPLLSVRQLQNVCVCVYARLSVCFTLLWSKHNRWPDHMSHVHLSPGLIPSGKYCEQGCSESFKLWISVFISSV